MGDRRQETEDREAGDGRLETGRWADGRRETGEERQETRVKSQEVNTN